jgi:ribosomal protein L27
MGGRVGGISSKFYVETAGIKVSGGQKVKAGTVLTREGNRWKAGLNVNGRSSLTAGIEGEVYFTRKKNPSKKVITIINIKPVV